MVHITGIHEAGMRLVDVRDTTQAHRRLKLIFQYCHHVSMPNTAGVELTYFVSDVELPLRRTPASTNMVVQLQQPWHPVRSL